MHAFCRSDSSCSPVPIPEQLSIDHDEAVPTDIGFGVERCYTTESNLSPIRSSMDANSSSETNTDRWVFLDVVGTLLMPTPDVSEIYAEVGAKHGSQRTAEEIAKEFQLVYTALTTDERETNEEKEREFWAEAVSRLLPDVEDANACFDELFDRFAKPESWRAFNDVKASFAKLREYDYKIALASNFDARLRPIAEAMPPLDSVDAVIVSTEVGWKKPSRQFWYAALEATGADPKRSVTVGDSYNEDVKVPRQLGLRGFWLQRSSERRPVAVRTLTEVVERVVAARPPG